MAQSRKIRLTKRISVSFGRFYMGRIPCESSPYILHLLPSILLLNFAKLQVFPRYIIRFKWLRLHAGVNIFIEDSHNEDGQKSVRFEEVFNYEAKDNCKI